MVNDIKSNFSGLTVINGFKSNWYRHTAIALMAAMLLAATNGARAEERDDLEKLRVHLL